MLLRITLVFLLMILCSACASQNDQNLHISTPAVTPEVPTATLPAVPPSPTAHPTAIPSDVIKPDNLKQIKLLHQYWLVVATAAGVDPYEMAISAIAASPNGRWLAVGGCSKHLEVDLRSSNVYCNGTDSQAPQGTPFLLILDVDNESVIGTIPENQPVTTVADLAFTHDGKKLIYAIQPNKIAVWDIASAKVESVLWNDNTSAPKIAISPDDSLYVFKTTDRLEIWDTTSAKFIAEIPSDYRPQFSMDGEQMLVNYQREFILYETKTWTEIERIQIPCDCVYALSPDLSLLATSELNPTDSVPILIWDVATGKQLQSLEGIKDSSMFLSFSPDGRMLWSAGKHGALTAWDTQAWKLLAENIGTFVPIINLRGFEFIDNGRNYLILSDQHLGLYGLP
jgi:WD40 repeat protein